MADAILGPPAPRSPLPFLRHHHHPRRFPPPRRLFRPAVAPSPAPPKFLVVGMAAAAQYDDLPRPSSSCCLPPSANPSASDAPSLLVFSGGTAFNGVVEELKKMTTRVAHVLPVSDDGGSTAEIVRVLGGPAVGDIRSRCLRLSDESTSEALAVRRLLGHRLPLDPAEAKLEWYQIVEGDHALWDGVSRPYGETIRAFLVYFQDQILRHSRESFCFSNGSIGNFFFAGARIFFQSLDAAIFLFSRVSDIPKESLVLPVISTNDRLTLGCELMVCRGNAGDGTAFSFWHDEWTVGGALGVSFPRLMAQSVNPDASVSEYWTSDSWTPLFRTGLSDGRLTELLTMLERITAYRPAAERGDGWVWLDGHYSAGRLYRQLLPACSLSAELRLDYRRIWQSTRVPLKIKIFTWLL